MRIRSLALFGIAILIAQPASTQPNLLGQERYVRSAEEFVEERNEHLVRYEAIPLEQLARPDVMVFRTFFDDAWGRPSPLVEFRRVPGDGPRVIVTLPDQGGRMMEAPISGEAWDRIANAAYDFAEDYDPPASSSPPDPDEGITVCADGWMRLVEVIDERGEIRRRARHSCLTGVLHSYSDLLFDEALLPFPDCIELTPRFPSMRGLLEGCVLLEGDRAAAAQAWRAMEDAHLSETGQGQGGISYQRSVMQYGTVARIEGFPEAQRVGGVAELWANRLPQGRFTFDRIIGHTAERVSVIGRFRFSTPDSEGPDREMPVRMEWRRGCHDCPFWLDLIEAGTTVGEPGSDLPD